MVNDAVETARRTGHTLIRASELIVWAKATMTAPLTNPLLPFAELPEHDVQRAEKKANKPPKAAATASQLSLRTLNVISNEQPLLESPLHRYYDRHSRSVVIRMWVAAPGAKSPPGGAAQFVIDEITQFHDYVPRRKYSYLGQHFRSWIMHLPSLFTLGYELEQLGAECVGDVVQMTEAEILEKTSATPRLIAALQRDLAKVGLKLGMKVPKATPFTRGDTHLYR